MLGSVADSVRAPQLFLFSSLNANLCQRHWPNLELKCEFKEAVVVPGQCWF